MPVLDAERLIDERVVALAAAHRVAGIPRAELDLSGGVDSAVVAGLLVLALGPEHVTLVYSGIHSNPASLERACAIAKALACPLAVLDLGNLCDDLVAKVIAGLDEAGTTSLAAIRARMIADPTILGSIRSTLRAPVGRAANRLSGGGIRHGTGNEDEDRWLRFYQKGGDGEVDSNPIAFLSKGEVYQLAFALGQRFDRAAFRAVIEAMPSPDLWAVGDLHADERELASWLGAPFTYSRIDPDTGAYRSVGTIERVSRFLDRIHSTPDGGLITGEALLFDDLEPVWLEVLARALASGLFRGLDPDIIQALLRGARKAERATRHKLNPNCPTYGNRRDLVEEGILTNDLPDLRAAG